MNSSIANRASRPGRSLALAFALAATALTGAGPSPAADRPATRPVLPPRPPDAEALRKLGFPVAKVEVPSHEVVEKWDGSAYVTRVQLDDAASRSYTADLEPVAIADGGSAVRVQFIPRVSQLNLTVPWLDPAQVTHWSKQVGLRVEYRSGDEWLSAPPSAFHWNPENGDLSLLPAGFGTRVGTSVRVTLATERATYQTSQEQTFDPDRKATLVLWPSYTLPEQQKPGFVPPELFDLRVVSQVDATDDPKLWDAWSAPVAPGGARLQIPGYASATVSIGHDEAKSLYFLDPMTNRWLGWGMFPGRGDLAGTLRLEYEARLPEGFDRVQPANLDGGVTLVFGDRNHAFKGEEIRRARVGETLSIPELYVRSIELAKSHGMDSREALRALEGDARAVITSGENRRHLARFGGPIPLSRNQLRVRRGALNSSLKVPVTYIGYHYSVKLQAGHPTAGDVRLRIKTTSGDWRDVPVNPTRSGQAAQWRLNPRPPGAAADTADLSVLPAGFGIADVGTEMELHVKGHRVQTLTLDPDHSSTEVGLKADATIIFAPDALPETFRGEVRMTRVNRDGSLGATESVPITEGAVQFDEVGPGRSRGMGYLLARPGGDDAAAWADALVEVRVRGKVPVVRRFDGPVVRIDALRDAKSAAASLLVIRNVPPDPGPNPLGELMEEFLRELDARLAEAPACRPRAFVLTSPGEGNWPRGRAAPALADRGHDVPIVAPPGRAGAGEFATLWAWVRGAAVQPEVAEAPTVRVLVVTPYHDKLRHPTDPTDLFDLRRRVDAGLEMMTVVVGEPFVGQLRLDRSLPGSVAVLTSTGSGYDRQEIQALATRTRKWLTGDRPSK